MTKICLLLVCILTMVCGAACAAEISVQDSVAETGPGVFTIATDEIIGTEGIGFRLSYDPDDLNITGVTNISDGIGGYVNYHADDGNLSVALIFPGTVTVPAGEPLVSVAYTTRSSEPRSVLMRLHDSEYSASYQNLDFARESEGIFSFRKVVTDTIKNGTWSARTPARYRYEMVPGAIVHAPYASNGGKTVFLSDLAVRKCVEGSWVAVSPANVSVAEDGNVTLSGDLGDVAKLDLTFTGRVSGDVNANGITNSADARDIARHARDLSSLDEMGVFYGDVNRDGLLDQADAREVAEYAAGILDEHFHQRS
ncbi:hypothetical protein J2129_000202 [Methanofollis sp. W23]|uniref:dockerin type I repeat-containing protein n=1 Tax=Methanofollis sp. W23 TaxID=2817849 RepID=UPI001AE98815|nr:dockerin type I repeat-containing protein [Methanofollis sp. W23]MBP2144748.1 hypothetical protein [Methanofollis sp. W23]